MFKSASRLRLAVGFHAIDLLSLVLTTKGSPKSEGSEKTEHFSLKLDTK
jgi:hypothetical protein